ncbi:hypothetical protein WICMUC_000329 [Wickerhamomyces mucosus]|uniref:NmrA-like domain-containing protein n=1 Tax=Wickerhamomyces mucosus TaxID=1378264 RepID=A0A9P8PXQ3_9ASCO|nr:hypothetical protein WICMUC_000329 [Wickerhamomyces mucosus]
MTSVAVIGLNGRLGKPIIESLLSEPFISKINTPIKLLTTNSDKQVVSNDKLQYINYKTLDGGLKTALKDVDVVINLGNIPKSPIQDILDAIIANNVKLYIPSQFGTDLQATEVDFPGFLNVKTQHSKAARDAGIKTVDVITGLFIEDDQTYSGRPFGVFNFNEEKKEIEIIGDEDESIQLNPSFFRDIGNSVAAIVTSSDYSKIPNRVRIFSDKVTLGDYIKRYENQTGIKLNRTYKKVDEIVQEAKLKYQNFSFADFGFYLKTFAAQGENKGLTFEKENEKEIINPNESLFKWTKYVV